MKAIPPVRTAMLLCLLAMTPRVSYAIYLFDGTSLSGWTYYGVPWVVSRYRTLQNAGSGDSNDWIEYDTQLPPDPFTLEMRIRVLNCTNTTPRPRVILVPETVPYEIHDVGKIYFGNEGFTNQFEIYGDHLTNINQVGDDSYDLGVWYTLRFEVDGRNQVSFFKDDVLTHTATRTTVSPLNIVIRPGDSWSAGRIEISSIEYIPEPTTLLLLGLGALALSRRQRQQ
ncbi:MAG: PEP-CTERM sorting domain-containing protein [Planctomycetota bacterium]